MARGRLEPPNLDDRTWQDLVDQAKALIPQYAPQWTDHGPSDPGMTLIELFAWLVEGMIYRLNRVPEKNYVAFLNLLGITRSPATPATTWLTYTSSAKVTLAAGTQAATQQTETQQAIVFETDAELTVLPSKLVKLYVDGMASPDDKVQLDLTAQLVGPEPQGRGIVGWDTLKGNQATFWLGFDARATDRYALHLEIADPKWEGTRKLAFSYSKADGSWGTIQQGPAPLLIDETAGLRRTGTIGFNPPDDWAPIKVDQIFTKKDFEADKPRHWLKMVFTASPKGDSKTVLKIKHVLFNSVTATAVQTVKGELVGLGTGKPFQSFELANRPLYKDPRSSRNPYDHLKLAVGEGDSPGKTWTLVEEMGTAGKAEVYRVDPVTGTIYFGSDQDEKSGDLVGKAPPAGSPIVAEYRYVPTGAAGNVPAGAINTHRVPKPEIRVINPVQAYGGTDEEDIERTKQRAPRELRNFNRAVTLEDYEDLACRATNRVKKVRCLGPRFSKSEPSKPENFAGMPRQEGTVYVIILPDVSHADKPKEIDPHPSPPIELIHEVQRYLDDRRPLTAKLVVTGPRYLEVTITGTVLLWPDALDVGVAAVRSQSKEALKDKIDQAIVRYLHPIKGNSDGNGWKVGEHFFVSGLFQFLQQTTIGDLGYIESLTAKGNVGYDPKPRPSEKGLPPLDVHAGVSVADYEIVCSKSDEPDKPWHEITVKVVGE